jgi:hypothetical protein
MSEVARARKSVPAQNALETAIVTTTARRVYRSLLSYSRSLVSYSNIDDDCPGLQCFQRRGHYWATEIPGCGYGQQSYQNYCYDPTMGPKEISNAGIYIYIYFI